MAFAVRNKSDIGWWYNMVSKQDFSHEDILKIPPFKIRRSTFMATVSHSNITTVDLQKIIEAGVNIIKLKLADSTGLDKIKILNKVKTASEYLSSKYNIPEWPVASCLGLKTSLVKTGILEGDVHKIRLLTGSSVLLTNNIKLFDKCNERQIFVDNPHLKSEVDNGMEISLVTDDEIILKCTEIIDENNLKCIVTKGGHLRNLTTTIVRGGRHTKPLLTKHDMELLKFALEYKIDILVINYVRSPETIRQIKNFFGKKAQRPILFSYLSTEEDLIQFNDILKESDGIFFSREFLPYELDVSKQYRWMMIQKWASAKCSQAGKPFIISGGVLQGTCLKGSIRNNELADVTNAILDGATGFVLKDWSNVDSLVECVKLLNDICTNVSATTASFSSFARLVDEIKLPVNAAEACMIACVAAAYQTYCNVIIIPTVTGKTAKAICRLQSPSFFIVLTNKTRIVRMLHTYRGIMPLKYEGQRMKADDAIEERIQYAVKFAVARKFLTYGETFVTLRRGSATSFYCDTVEIRTTSLHLQSYIEYIVKFNNTYTRDNGSQLDVECAERIEGKPKAIPYLVPDSNGVHIT